MHTYWVFFIFSFEGVVAYQIRYSIIMACDHSFSVLYTHLGERLGAEALIYSMMCGESSETVCDGKAIICMIV